MKMRTLFAPIALLAVIGCGPGESVNPRTGGNGQAAAPAKTKDSAETYESAKKLLAMSVDKWAEVLNDKETKAQLTDLTNKVKQVEGLEADYLKAKNDGVADAEKVIADYSRACVEASKLAQEIVSKLRPKEKNIRDVMDLGLIAVDPKDRSKLIQDFETLTTPHEPLKDPLRNAGKFLLPLNEIVAESDRLKPGEKTSDHYLWAAKTILEKKAKEAKSKQADEKK